MESESHVPQALRTGAMTPEGRPQDHCTPLGLVAPAYRVMGGIDLDPASNVGSVVKATRSICWEQLRDDALELPPGFEWGDGLKEDWSGLRVWLQPNWDELEPWLERAAFYSLRGAEVFALIPVRTHRVYWKYVWEAQGVTFLPPITFGDAEHQAPFACCFVYWGPNAEKFAVWTAPFGQPFVDGGRPLCPRKVPMTESTKAELAAMKLDGALGFLTNHPELSITQIEELDPDLASHVKGIPLGDLYKVLKGMKAPGRRRTQQVPPVAVSGPQESLPGTDADPAAEGDSESDPAGEASAGDASGAAPDPRAPLKRIGDNLTDQLRAFFGESTGPTTINDMETHLEKIGVEVSRATLRRRLKVLKDEGVIEQQGDTRGAEYIRVEAAE